MQLALQDAGQWLLTPSRLHLAVCFAAQLQPFILNLPCAGMYTLIRRGESSHESGVGGVGVGGVGVGGEAPP